MDINEIPDTLKSIIKNTAGKLGGATKREYDDKIAIELLWERSEQKVKLVGAET